MRIITRAELTGVPETVPIKGKIRSSKGTIRGKRNAVRASLEVLTGEQMMKGKVLQKKMYDDERLGRKLVMYTTTNTVIRSTFDTCSSLLKLFDIMRLKVFRNDVYMDPGLLDELKERAPNQAIPCVFVNGNLLGGSKEVLEMNETGKLKEILKDFAVQPTEGCKDCGGAGYITCTWCQGSGKSVKNPFDGHQGQEVGLTSFLKCTVCISNGLQRCPTC